jgi:hypothetical protein
MVGSDVAVVISDYIYPGFRPGNARDAIPILFRAHRNGRSDLADQGKYIIAETAEGQFGSTIFGILEG